MYRIYYHYLVIREDIPKIPKLWKEKIRLAIEKKLTLEPSLYGKPLRRSLRGYLKIRVGDYRIVFKVEKSVVKILIIKHRSAVYGEAGHRAK